MPIPRQARVFIGILVPVWVVLWRGFAILQDYHDFYTTKGDVKLVLQTPWYVKSGTPFVISGYLINGSKTKITLSRLLEGYNLFIKVKDAQGKSVEYPDSNLVYKIGGNPCDSVYTLSPGERLYLIAPRNIREITLPQGGDYTLQATVNFASCEKQHEPSLWMGSCVSNKQTVMCY